MTPSQLRRARLALGLTQSAIGSRIGASKIHVYRMERGLRGITPDTESRVRDMLIAATGAPRERVVTEECTLSTADLVAMAERRLAK